MSTPSFDVGPVPIIILKRTLNHADHRMVLRQRIPKRLPPVLMPSSQHAHLVVVCNVDHPQLWFDSSRCHEPCQFKTRQNLLRIRTFRARSRRQGRTHGLHAAVGILSVSCLIRYSVP